jgi:hypothetical protein
MPPKLNFSVFQRGAAAARGIGVGRGAAAFPHQATATDENSIVPQTMLNDQAREVVQKIFQGEFTQESQKVLDRNPTLKYLVENVLKESLDFHQQATNLSTEMIRAVEMMLGGVRSSRLESVAEGAFRYDKARRGFADLFQSVNIDRLLWESALVRQLRDQSIESGMVIVNPVLEQRVKTSKQIFSDIGNLLLTSTKDVINPESLASLQRSVVGLGLVCFFSGASMSVAVPQLILLALEVVKKLMGPVAPAVNPVMMLTEISSPVLQSTPAIASDGLIAIVQEALGKEGFIEYFKGEASRNEIVSAKLRGIDLDSLTLESATHLNSIIQTEIVIAYYKYKSEDVALLAETQSSLSASAATVTDDFELSLLGEDDAVFVGPEDYADPVAPSADSLQGSAALMIGGWNVSPLSASSEQQVVPKANKKDAEKSDESLSLSLA